MIAEATNQTLTRDTARLQESPSYASCMDASVICHVAMGNVTNAVAAQKQSVQRLRALLPPDHPQLAGAYGMLSSLQALIGLPTEAAASLKSATCAATSPDASKTHHRLNCFLNSTIVFSSLSI